MEEPKWYVAHTFSGYENKVASNILTVVENRNLHDLIYEVAIPTETVKELKIKLWVFRALVVIVVLGIIMLLIIKHKKNKKEYDEEDDNTDNKYDKDILPKSLRNLDEDSIKKMIKDYNGNESPKVGVDNVENSKKEGFNDYNNNIIIQENYSKIKNDDELQKKGKRSGNGRKKGKRFK